MKADTRKALGLACRWGAIVLLGIGYSVLSHMAAASASPGLPEALVAIIPLLGLAFVMAWRAAQPLPRASSCRL